MEKTRPIGVTILAFLAILGAVNALIYTLQMLHILPVFIGPVAFFEFSLINDLSEMKLHHIIFSNFLYPLIHYSNPPLCPFSI